MVLLSSQTFGGLVHLPHAYLERQRWGQSTIEVLIGGGETDAKILDQCLLIL
jgi:hypothetical protein